MFEENGFTWSVCRLSALFFLPSADGDDGKVDVLPDGPVGLEVRGAAGGSCKYFN